MQAIHSRNKLLHNQGQLDLPFFLPYYGQPLLDILYLRFLRWLGDNCGTHINLKGELHIAEAEACKFDRSR